MSSMCMSESAVMLKWWGVFSIYSSKMTKEVVLDHVRVLYYTALRGDVILPS